MSLTERLDKRLLLELRMYNRLFIRVIQLHKKLGSWVSNSEYYDHSMISDRTQSNLTHIKGNYCILKLQQNYNFNHHSSLREVAGIEE